MSFLSNVFEKTYQINPLIVPTFLSIGSGCLEFGLTIKNKNPRTTVKIGYNIFIIAINSICVYKMSTHNIFIKSILALSPAVGYGIGSILSKACLRKPTEKAWLELCKKCITDYDPTNTMITGKCKILYRHHCNTKNFNLIFHSYRTSPIKKQTLYDFLNVFELLATYSFEELNKLNKSEILDTLRSDSEQLLSELNERIKIIYYDCNPDELKNLKDKLLLK